MYYRILHKIIRVRSDMPNRMQKSNMWAHTNAHTHRQTCISSKFSNGIFYVVFLFTFQIYSYVQFSIVFCTKISGENVNRFSVFYTGILWSYMCMGNRFDILVVNSLAFLSMLSTFSLQEPPCNITVHIAFMYEYVLHSSRQL